MSDQALGAAPRPGIVTGSAPRLPPARLGVAVVTDLVSAIVTGELQPGDVLPPEGDLSDNFGVSRTVIRESVKRVEEKGLVTVAQGRGTQASIRSTSWNMLDPVVLSALVDNDASLGILDELDDRAQQPRGARWRPSRGASTDAGASEELRAAFDATEQNIDDFERLQPGGRRFHYSS